MASTAGYEAFQQAAIESRCAFCFQIIADNVFDLYWTMPQARARTIGVCDRCWYMTVERFIIEAKARHDKVYEKAIAKIKRQLAREPRKILLLGEGKDGECPNDRPTD